MKNVRMAGVAFFLLMMQLVCLSVKAPTTRLIISSWRKKYAKRYGTIRLLISRNGLCPRNTRRNRR